MERRCADSSITIFVLTLENTFQGLDHKLCSMLFFYNICAGKPIPVSVWDLINHILILTKDWVHNPSKYIRLDLKVCHLVFLLHILNSGH